MQTICNKNIRFSLLLLKRYRAKILHMEEVLSQSNLKVTKPRLAVLGALSSANYPLSAQAVYELVAKEGLNLSTVYRTLNSFVEAGLAKKEVNVEKENVYSLISQEDNHVLVCVKCHKKMPLPGCPYHEANEKIEEETGFSILDHNTEIYGICPDCRSK